VQKILLIAFRAGEMAGADGHEFELGLSERRADFGYGFFVERGVGDDAPFGYVSAGKFELRFYQDQKIGVWFEERGGGLENSCGGDEGDVGDYQIEGRLSRDVVGAEIACVSFDLDYARVLLEFPSKLIGVDVDGEDFCGAGLEKAVGEASGAGADVDASEACGIQREIFQGTFEFEAAAAGEFEVAAGDLEARNLWDGVAGFVGGLAVDANFASEDQGTGFGKRFCQTAFDEECVQAFAGGFGFHHGVVLRIGLRVGNVDRALTEPSSAVLCN
jgi:hypothetical protein